MRNNSTQQKTMHAGRARRAWLAVIIGLAGAAGAYQFQRILNALPDSNDDFIFF